MWTLLNLVHTIALQTLNVGTGIADRHNAACYVAIENFRDLTN
jgi:hypothetical protein